MCAFIFYQNKYFYVFAQNIVPDLDFCDFILWYIWIILFCVDITAPFESKSNLVEALLLEEWTKEPNHQLDSRAYMDR